MDEPSSISPHSMVAGGLASDMPPKSEVDDFLRRKRKAREHKACYPCRQRKVRCDLGRPCKTCVEREHPELCDYHPPSKRQNVGLPAGGDAKTDDLSSHSGPTVTVAQASFDQLCRKLDSMESTIEDLRREMKSTYNSFTHRTPQLSGQSSPMHGRMDGSIFGSTGNASTRHTSLHGFHARNDLTGQTVHLGGSSVPALVMALGQGNSSEQPSLQELLGKSMLPIFGLDNETATYPFVDLWGLAHGSLAKAGQLAKTIPADSQCLSFFHYYRDLGHAIYPAVADPGQFEQDMTIFLMNRSRYQEIDSGIDGQPVAGVTEQMLYDKDLNWVGLLFAVLASGCQCSNLPRKERELTSQVYICCSFECLRFVNFLSHATLESVQTLLVLGNVLQNNMNAGTAWNLLGLTVRLAQSLGLHQVCPPPVPPEVKAIRTKIWWNIMWHDSLLSITYDRASSTALMDHSMAIPSIHDPLPPFHIAMYRICKVGLDVVRDRSKRLSSKELLLRMNKCRDEIQTIVKESADFLRDSRQCRSLRDSIQHWCLYLHVSYITSELCRPAISPSTTDPELMRNFKQTCVDSLINVVEAWLGFQNLTSYARRSWASVHRALSSALLLGIMGEQAHNERCRKLLGRFVALMGDITGSVAPQELAAPMERAIATLRRIKIHDASPPLPPPTLTTANSAPPTTTTTAPRFIEDIALGGAGPTPTSPDAYQPSVVSGQNATTTEEEESPYSVLNSILWGNGPTP